MSSRKRPHCHTCGSPMAGHRRRDGISICPKPVSPPSTPISPGSSKQHDLFLFRRRTVSQPLPICETTNVKGPSSPTISLPSPAPSVPFEEMPGRWRRRQNPNWPYICRFQSPTEYAPAASDVPTERVDRDLAVKGEDYEDLGVPLRGGASDTSREYDEEDGEGEQGEGEQEEEEYEEEEDREMLTNEHTWEENSSALQCDALSNASGESQTSDNFFDDVLRNSDPLASVFHTPREEIGRVEHAARGLGLHIGTIHRPRRTRANPGMLKRDSSWWMVIGKDGEAVNHILEMQNRASMRVMPGHIGPDSELDHTPRIATRWDSAIAGAFGGLAVVFALACMSGFPR